MSGFDNEVVVSLGARLEPSTAQAIMLMQKNPTDVSRINHEGDPEGVVAANPSSLCHDPVAGKVYIKREGTSNSGWADIAPDNVPVGGLAYFSIANGDAYLADLWLKCDGAILNQADHPLLFERIGFINGPFTNFLTTTTYTSSFVVTMTYDGTRLVAAGSGGNVGTSTDGITWTSTTPPTTLSIQGLVYNGSIYAASAGQQVLTTTNLSTWTARQAGNVNASQMVWNGSVYLLTHTTRYTATSTDAITWKTRTPQGVALAYGNGNLVAGSTLNAVFVSANPTAEWTVTSANVTSTALVANIEFLNNLFVYVSGTSSTIATSTDGFTWTPRTTGTTTTWSTAAFGNSLYMIGSNGGGVSRVTTDFTTYTAALTGGGTSIANLAYGAGKFLTVQNTTIYTTTDGVAWSNSGTLTGGGTPATIKFVNGLFIAGGSAGFYSTSTDGITWSTSSPYGALAMQDLSFANSLYLACFSNGSIGSSTDAITWTTHTTLTTDSQQGILYDGTRYYVTADKLMQTSTDLITWTRLTNLPTSTELLNVLTFGNSLYLIGTSAGNILSSTDALTWASHATLTSSPLGSLFGGNGIYVTSRQSTLYRSTDLTTFTVVLGGATSTQTINVVGFVNGLYLAGGQQGYIRTSTDAITWDQVSTTITNQAISTVAASPDAIAFGGASGFVGYSLDTYPYDETTQFQLPTDGAANITLEYPSNFRRALYVRAA